MFVPIFISCVIIVTAFFLYKWRAKKIPIVIITDIGTDPDDILAIMLACAVQKFDILAVITTGGDTINRGRVARRWMDIVGMDPDVPVIPDMATGSGNTRCFIPEDTPSKEEYFLTIGKKGEDLAANAIVQLARDYSKDLGIFVIGPLTPLAKACKLYPEIVQQIGFLSIQGQLKVSGYLIEPDFSSFNLREDNDAAKVVFETLQHTVPFKLLGKHAAYATPLSKDDIIHIPNLTSEVKTFLSILMERNPDLFQRLYPASEDKVASGTWFEDLDHICNPYDPLLFLSFAYPDLFQHQHHGQHTTVGNDEHDHGVKDAEEIKQKLRDCTVSFFKK